MRHCTKNLILCTTIFFLLTNVSFADDPGRRSYWLNKYGKAKEPASTTRAYEVFKTVLAAADRRAEIVPELYIISYDGNPWAQSLADGSVILTKKAIDFCYRSKDLGTGDSILAFIIG